MLDVYPIGKAQVPAAFDQELVRRSIEAMSQLPAELRQVVAGCSDLDQPIREGAWTIRALVHHIADSHLNAYVRTKLALTEDSPIVKDYDEESWSRLADSRMDPGPSLELIEALHLRWVALLASLEQAQLERPWQMPGGEPRPLWRLPIIYAWHGRHHVAQIRQAREAYRLAAVPAESDHRAMLQVALQEARQGLAEGGIPIGAALFRHDGTLLGRGHNRRVQDDDPSSHGETVAFRNAGRQRDYRDTIMVTTLAPCWYCSGLVKQFGIRTVVVGESRTFKGGANWLREQGVHVIDLDDQECVRMMERFIAARPELWNEDIGLQ